MFSGLKSIFAGVSQGYLIGPLLFFVYINYIARHLSYLTRLFADDVSPFYILLQTLLAYLVFFNHDLQLLSNLARQCQLVTFNPLKSKDVLFSLKKLNSLPQLVVILLKN